MVYTGVPTPYLFYSVISNLTWSGGNILALLLIIIPSWCNVYGIAKKSKSVQTLILPPKYTKIKLLFNDLEYQMRRGIPYFVLFIIRSIVMPIIILVGGAFLSIDIPLTVSIILTGVVLLYLCVFRPMRTRL
jgi:hypothetical protein